MPFNAAQLIASAREKTGLEDFGDPGFREGLEVLVDALEREAVLDRVGRTALSARLLGYLVQRLRVEDCYRAHPEIGGEELHAPLVVIGLRRTGTSPLADLLAQDPATRSLRVWESAAPTPPPEAATQEFDPRIDRAQTALDWLHTAAPALRAIRQDTATGPTEAQDLLGMSFRTQHFDGFARVPSYVDWWLGCDMLPAYAYQRRVLALLQWHCPPRRWQLKSPPDLFALDALTAVHPDARIVWTHRDPARVLASACSLVAAVRAVFGDPVDREELGRSQLDQWSEAAARALAFREKVGEARFLDVFMSDLAADSVGTVAGIYDHFGLPFTQEAEQAMRAWSEANPRGRYGLHEPQLSDFGLARDEVRDAFRPYVQRFGL